MELGIRLKSIANMVKKCNKAADIGTDHGYIPIYLVKNNVCRQVIAADINEGPVKKAEHNILIENLEKSIECRLGAGLSVIKPFEVEGIIIAGMGGNLIRDIIDKDIDVFKSLKFSILQPVQNPEVLRKYVYSKGYKIVEEDLCIEDGKFYEIMNIKYGDERIFVDPIFYEISKLLIDKKHPLIGEFIEYKIDRYYNSYNKIKQKTEGACLRKQEISEKIQKLKELLKCL